MLKSRVLYLIVGFILIGLSVPHQSTSSMSTSPPSYTPGALLSPLQTNSSTTQTTTAPTTTTANTTTDTPASTIPTDSSTARLDGSATLSTSAAEVLSLSESFSASSDFFRDLLVMGLVVLGILSLYPLYHLFRRFVIPHFRVNPPTGGPNYQKFSTYLELAELITTSANMSLRIVIFSVVLGFGSLLGLILCGLGFPKVLLPLSMFVLSLLTFERGLLLRRTALSKQVVVRDMNEFIRKNL